VKDTAEFLRKLGAPVEFIEVDRNGQISLSQLEGKIEQFQPTLVSVMAANNETGVIFPNREISEICQKHKVYFHTDAVQAFGKLPAMEWNSAHLISITAHKVHGPKGVGALIIRKGTALRAIHYGGAQEIKRRGGTENVPGILGFAAACSELMGPEDWKNLKTLRDHFESQLLQALPSISLNGSEPRIPNTSSFRVEGVPSEVLLGALDLDGISISVGSACSSGSISPSHVLLAMGFTTREAKECIRVSWGKTTTSQDIDKVLESMVRHVHRIRERKKAQ
jgi:cysteine desulfurase